MELIVAADLAKRGWEIAVPWGETPTSPDRVPGDRLERVQVKYSGASPDIVVVRCQSHSLTNGRVRQTKHYTAAMIDWIAVYHEPSDRCFYVPASQLGAGRARLHLRLSPSLNNQRTGIRNAEDYTEFGGGLMEPAGLEPAASDLQSRRSPN